MSNLLCALHVCTLCILGSLWIVCSILAIISSLEHVVFSLLSCTNMNFISFLYFPLQYCFEIYSADNSSSLIKACKTDSEGKVVEGLCVCFTILICHGTLCSYPSHQAVSFTWSVCRTPWCLSHLCSFWRRKRNLDWVYKVSCFLVCSIIITQQHTLEFVLRSMPI